VLESPTSLTIEDFKQRYGRSFGFLITPETGQKLLVAITGVSSQKVTFDSVSASGYFVFVDKGVQFEFIPITRGWFRTQQHGAVLLNRVPARQWTRGISRQNTTAAQMSSGRLYPIDLTLQILHDIFVSPIPEDINTFNSKKEFIVNKYFLLKSGVVYCYSKEIGVYKDTTIFLHTDIMVQELSDAIRRQSLPFTVELAQ
jgi:hypothetical protein